MFRNKFASEFLNAFVGLNVVTLVFGSIVECFNPNSIFKPATRKQNEKYWNKRVIEAIKGFVYSMPTFIIGSVTTAIWEVHYAEIYYEPKEFELNVGQFLIQMVIYFILLDFLGYWQHRLFHIRAPINLYKHIHSYHHQFHPITSYANSAEHPIEALLIPSLHFVVAIIASWIFPFDPTTHQIAGLLVMLFGLVVHDGTFCEYHKTHHDTVHFNFANGYSQFWDVLCNTYKDSSERLSSVYRIKQIKWH